MKNAAHKKKYNLKKMEKAENPREMEIVAKKGVIGFFDILGFKNYIRNDPDVASKQALQILLNIKADVPSKIKKRVSIGLVDEVSWNIFSDTIMLAIPYSQTKTGVLETKENTERWLTLLLSSIALLDHMFDNGLPIRGAISFGKFFVHENCLAGKAIVDAHETAQKLNFSGAVLDEIAETELRRLTPATFQSGGGVYIYMTLLNYLAPRKDTAKKQLVLNQWALSDTHDNDDIPQLVAEAFWKHGKDIDEDAANKLKNTEMLLRYIVATKQNVRSGKSF